MERVGLFCCISSDCELWSAFRAGGYAGLFYILLFLFPAPCGFRDFTEVVKSNDICEAKPQFMCSQRGPVCSVCEAQRGASL